MDFMSLLKILVLLAIVLFLFSCRQKKERIKNVEQWLDQHFPGQFMVVDTRMSDPIKNLSFKVKKSILAKKDAPLVQIEVKWDARVEGLELDKQEIIQQFEIAEQQFQTSQKALQDFKSAGFSNLSIGMRNDDYIILFFQEMTQNDLQAFAKQVMEAWINLDLSQGHYAWFGLMDPHASGELFGEFIPLKHWVLDYKWQNEHTWFFLEVPPGEALKKIQAKASWKLNEGSLWMKEKALTFKPQIQKWALEKGKGQMKLLEYIVTEAGQQDMELIFKYPYEVEADSSKTIHDYYYIQAIYDHTTGQIHGVKSVKAEKLPE